MTGERGTAGTRKTGDHQKVTHASMLLPAPGEDLSVTGHSTFAEQHQQTGDGRRLSVLVGPSHESSRRFRLEHPTVTVLSTRLFLHERMSPSQITGLAVVAISMVTAG